MEYPLYDQSVVIDDDVIQYSRFYIAAEEATDAMLERFTRKLEASKRDITKSNYANVLGMMASDFMAIFSGTFDAIWGYLTKLDIKLPKRDALRERIEAVWMEDVKRLYDRQIYPVPHLVFLGFSGEGGAEKYVEEAFAFVRAMDTGSLSTIPKEVGRVAKAFPAKAAEAINKAIPNILKKNDYDLLAYHGVLRRYGSLGVNEDNVSEYVKAIAKDGAFDYDAYVLLYATMGDPKGEITSIMQALGFSDKFEKLQNDLIDDYVKGLNLNLNFFGYSLAQLMEYQRMIREKADSLGCKGSVKVINDLEKRISDVKKAEERDKKRREEAAMREGGDASQRTELDRAVERLDMAAEAEAEASAREDASTIAKTPTKNYNKKLVELTDYEVSEEIKLIKDGIKGKDVVGRYRFFLDAKTHDWKSDEAMRALANLEKSVMREKANLEGLVSGNAALNIFKYVELGVGSVLSVIAIVNVPVLGVILSVLTIGGFLALDVFSREGNRASRLLSELNMLMGTDEDKKE